MSKDLTPLMRQYNQIKAKYPETILLFRMGDFFETFDDDAVITSKICGITLTKRNNGKAEASPLAGFPHHQLDTYLPKLVKGGCRVAVCEQIENPKHAQGIVKRGVVEVVTPGVSLYDKLLESKKNNYIAALYINKIKERIASVGVAFCDISTGDFLVAEIASEQVGETLDTYLPSEILFSKDQKEDIAKFLVANAYKISETKLDEWIFEPTFTHELLLRQFDTKNFKGFGIDDKPAGISAAGAILHYIAETQKAKLPHIKSIRVYTPGDYMLLDYPTRRNLEILCTMDGDTHASLITLLDKTLTPPGARLFKKWLNQPLNSLIKIHKRQDAVEVFVKNSDMLDLLRSTLYDFGDLERLISRIASGKATSRDIVVLAYSIERIPKIQELLKNVNNHVLNEFADKLDSLSELVAIIRNAMLEEPAIQFGNGNIFKTGYSAELDSYVQAKYSAKQWIAKFQEDERQSSGIGSLKVSSNGVFGYYIEITKTHNAKVPSNYERKQTLANAERYTVPELKEFEQKILNAEYKITEIEQALFANIKMQVSIFIEQIQHNAATLAAIDCLQSYATASLDYDYVKPIIDDSDVIKIEAGRHAVVERLLPAGERFMPNNTSLDSNYEQMHIITGPNMAGKSCYLRQTALIVLLGQIGCFVPAKSAHFGLIDRIFTRVGAQDSITTGESTFLIEMQETANILHNATNRSLILLDEVGRGTATFDGVSIAWSMAEHIHDVIGAKTLFATHYHELNELADRYERIVNYRVEVIEANNKIVFSHKVVKGSSGHSFGIYVATMAGLPASVVARANEIMAELENASDGTAVKQKEKLFGDTTKIATRKKNIPNTEQLSIFEFRDDKIREKLSSIDVNGLTPLQALQHLAELKESAKE